MPAQRAIKADASDIGAISGAAHSKGNGNYSVGSVGALANRRIEGARRIADGIYGDVIDRADVTQGEAQVAVARHSPTGRRLLASIVARRDPRPWAVQL